MDFDDVVVVGLIYGKAPAVWLGLFSYCFWLEWADAVTEFVGEFWFGVAGEEVVVDDLAEVGEPVAYVSDVACFEVADVLEVVSGLDEFVYFFVLGVDLFFEFALGFDEVLVGGCEVVAACAYPGDDAAYCYAGESDDGCD